MLFLLQRLQEQEQRVQARLPQRLHDNPGGVEWGKGPCTPKPPPPADLTTWRWLWAGPPPTRPTPAPPRAQLPVSLANRTVALATLTPAGGRPRPQSIPTLKRGRGQETPLDGTQFLTPSMSLPTEQHFSLTWSDPQGLGHPPRPLPALLPALPWRAGQRGRHLGGGGSDQCSQGLRGPGIPRGDRGAWGAGISRGPATPAS